MTAIPTLHNDPGMIIPYAGDIKKIGIPVGYLECNGQTLDSTDPKFQRLHRVIENIYGVGFDGFLCEIDTEGNLKIENEQAGTMIGAADVDTGLVVQIEKQGDADNKQVTKIISKSACEIPAGSHFMINGKETQWYVWFQIDGNGIDPKIAEKTGLRIILASTDSEKTVMEALVYQLSTVRFKVPDLRGMFVRGGPVDPNASRDPDFASRVGGNKVGSLQGHMFQAHNHQYTYNTHGGRYRLNEDVFPVHPVTTTGTTTISGGNETRPINMYLTYLIKY